MNTGHAAGIAILTFSAIVAGQPEGYLIFAMALLVLGTFILAGASTHWYRMHDYNEREAKFDEYERRRGLEEKRSKDGRARLGNSGSEASGGGVMPITSSTVKAPSLDSLFDPRTAEYQRVAEIHQRLADRGYIERQEVGSIAFGDVIGKGIVDANRAWMQDMINSDSGSVEHAKWQKRMKEKGYGDLDDSLFFEAKRQRIEEEWDDYVSWTS